MIIATPVQPAGAAAVEYSFIVPGHITVTTEAASEDAAREELWSGTTDTFDLAARPLTFGSLTVSALDLIAVAAKVDRVGEDVVTDCSLPDAAFHISDIARAAARMLTARMPGTEWTASAGAWAVTGHMEAPALRTGRYELAVVDGVLQLSHEELGRPFAAIRSHDILHQVAEDVAQAVLVDQAARRN